MAKFLGVDFSQSKASGLENLLVESKEMLRKTGFFMK
jgi:hypothetical protein